MTPSLNRLTSRLTFLPELLPLTANSDVSMYIIAAIMSAGLWKSASVASGALDALVLRIVL